ncbi:MAG TPA: helix-turn-helix transcriptional regulator [Polyangiaceae bacterium LLY-WYZ-15_(1-7)]|nr:hypothetical protein [Sandaracinus sp.]HJK93261.1 helix-turn-helix transcriptional regulator [Polyangiaceae bacterium LLY-WYZ-15_(1-7)]MBJ70530.1 hypothetical protein [Sandaracinus sp.]HJL06620.1 helix-turn-helix transcriptional regulator [Polyangiaceae bacterium LLY-WYZ-15_(1-7)]HJL09226.1 helix-turn-helix transcriptional regulator [Polyangiaceae bacterium LLY-WYZ-15_(1-7)]
MTRAHGGSRDEDPLLDARVEEARRRIAAAIRRRRRELGLTQEQAAEKLGCTTTHYQRVEYAQANVSLVFLAHLSLVMECDLEELLQPDRGVLRRRRTTKKAAN